MTFDDIDFLIIGAAKSATTAMQKALQRDPAVFMPDPELHYFSREYERGDAWYFEQFAGAAPGQTVGEKSNSYLDTPVAAPLIRKSLPNAKLIAQLRNPIERAYSDYCMLYRRSEVGRDIGNHLDPRLAADGRFLKGGLYHGQLSRFYDLYTDDQIMVVLFEDFKTGAESQLSDVRRFIGLPPGLGNGAKLAKVKDKTSPMLSPELRRRLRWLKPAVAPLRNTSAFKSLHRLVARETAYPPLTTDLTSRLVDFYAPDVERLSRLLKRDLSTWLTELPGSVV